MTMDHGNSEENIIYTCPMHPEIKQDGSGMCPECGMNLVPAKRKVASAPSAKAIPEKHAGHGTDTHAGHSTAMFLRKFWISLVLTIPVVLYSDVVKTVF